MNAAGFIAVVAASSLAGIGAGIALTLLPAPRWLGPGGRLAVALLVALLVFGLGSAVAWQLYPPAGTSSLCLEVE